MDIEGIKIIPILNGNAKAENDYYGVCWIQNGVQKIEINGSTYKNVSNAVFFFNPNFKWKVVQSVTSVSSGYVLYLPKGVFEHQTFKNLHINQVRLFNVDEIPKINLAPGIEKRIQALLEMLDELLSTNLAHREEAILSLLNAFFVYCDGKCNIKSFIADNNAKTALVYKLKKCIDQNISNFHEVKDYAQIFQVSDRYLNECVKDSLGVNVKHLIVEQLIMRARYELKFSDKSVKEISYELGFSSPEYFSYFFKKHLGKSPTAIRKD